MFFSRPLLISLSIAGLFPAGLALPTTNTVASDAGDDPRPVIESAKFHLGNATSLDTPDALNTAREAPEGKYPFIVSLADDTKHFANHDFDELLHCAAHAVDEPPSNKSPPPPLDPCPDEKGDAVIDLLFHIPLLPIE
ncbi:hypothetical protein MSAN_01311700 [Mycena sanguinolenta]|uniref:Uncharacterized protein n=1 Tax=Mycena sanguinolenta TaxID=230812 RepID=A0A8H6YFQ8_9AGAR|nr:hypothetical protein MSAN_01311700 [Mycena sanguinolenta]